MTYTNRVALMARALSRSFTPIVISEHGILSHSGSESLLPTWAHAQLTKSTYSLADRAIAVSEGVADNMSQMLDLRREEIDVIYNPVIGPKTFMHAEENVDHPWFMGESDPVIIGVGRLVEEKDFSSLLRAFAIVSRKRDVGKLAILGEGEKRSELERLADSLNVRDRVWMPGFVRNPLKYMARSDVFVFSSREEGLGNALIEAMATGIPVVSTDCEGGPNEVLENGKYGKLVPVEDPPALAGAIQEALDGHIGPAPRSALDRFRRGPVAEQYLGILSSVA
jgi:glycosyltransferase involved in cell wall biosynthesis